MPVSHITIMVAEDHNLLRQSLSDMIEKQKNLTVVGQAANGNELLELLKVKEPHILILDLQMPVLSGFKVLPQISTGFPRIKTIVLTSYGGKSMIRHVFYNGARCFLDKTCNPETLIQAINAVHSHGYYYDGDVTRLVISDLMLNNKLGEVSLSPVLSDRERSVLEQFCQGKSFVEIADLLFVSLSTVKFHLNNIYRKTEMSSAPALVKYAIRHGITNLDS